MLSIVFRLAQFLFFSISLSERGKSGQRRNVTPIKGRDGSWSNTYPKCLGKRMHHGRFCRRGRMCYTMKKEGRLSIQRVPRFFSSAHLLLSVATSHEWVHMWVRVCLMRHIMCMSAPCFHPWKEKKKRSKVWWWTNQQLIKKRREEIADAEDEQSATPRTLETRWRRRRRKKKKNTIQKVNTNCSVRQCVRWLQCVRWIFFFLQTVAISTLKKRKKKTPKMLKRESSKL